MAAASRILVKLNPGIAQGITDSSVRLKPLYGSVAEEQSFGISGQPKWYTAEVEADSAMPWDMAHSQVGDKLEIYDSDVLFAEPGLPHRFPSGNRTNPRAQPF